MNRLFLTLIFFARSILAQEPAPKPKFVLPEKSVTDGGQFTVHHGLSATRALIVQDIEVMVRNLEALIEKSPGKAHPIVIELYPAEEGKPGAVAEQLFELPEQKNSFRFQVSVRFSRGQTYPKKKLNETLLRLILIERGLRNAIADEMTHQIAIAPWIVDGISEAIAWRTQRGDRSVYAAIRDRGGWMEVDRIIEKESVEGLDPLSRELFRASSGALVMALLAQPEGKKAMRSFLLEASTFEGEQLALLRKHFPDVNLGREGLEKWWLSQVAALAEPNLTQVLSIPDTDAELEKSLKLYLTDDDGKPAIYGIEAWPEVMDLEENKDRVAAIQQATNLLSNLSFRCFPTYRPVIAGYLKTLTDLTGEERTHIPETLDNLELFREAEKRRHHLLVDYLDWYHLSTVREESGEFDDYLELKREFEKPSTPKNDPIIDYLDRAQKRFERLKQSR
ncbi:MAG: hypothetical protein ACON5H_03125 [Akkermansiaceae bacterium]